LRLLMPALMTSFAIGFAVSISLYLPSLFMGQGRVVTLTMEAVTAASGGDRRFIAVTGLLQAFLPFVIFILAQKMTSRLRMTA
jgi:putative thiamine transport system permease protein